MKGKRAWKEYRRLCALAAQSPEKAEAGLRALLPQLPTDSKLQALCHNDLGVLLAARGEADSAREEFTAALAADADCAAARANLSRLGESEAKPQRSGGPQRSVSTPTPAAPGSSCARPGPKIALVSLLFGWPSSGGGIHDTLGIGLGLQQQGVELRHFYFVHPPARIGEVSGACPLPGVAIHLDEETPTAEGLKRRLRAAVEEFAPEVVLITDSWSFKPHLLEALAGFRCYLRFHAAECLCPLNNIRFRSELADDPRCHGSFLAAPQRCLECLAANRGNCGSLHNWERELSGVEQAGFHDFLRAQLGSAAGAAVNNPLIAEALAPYLPNLRVITSGVNAEALFLSEPSDPPIKSILMAGMVEEPMKGLAVLRRACRMLWERRRDFQLLLTGQQVGQVDEFTRSVGWYPAQRLGELYAQADICVVPSVCEEAFGIVAVEAMAAGRPVVASRLGGLQFSVLDEVTGLLFAPGDAQELAQQLERLLDDVELRRRLGAAGRSRAADFDWRRIISRDYLPLLGGATVPENEPGAHLIHRQA